MTSEQLSPEEELAGLRRNINQAFYLAELAYQEAAQNQWERCYHQLVEAKARLNKSLVIALKNDTTS